MKLTVIAFTCLTLLSIVLISQPVFAGKAGVGVLNVSPEYRATRIIQSQDIIKVYLVISDYNSWRDIYRVDLLLKNKDVVMAQFRFKQYENTISYDEIDLFEETKGNGYLRPESCSVSRSSSKETVDDRCLLHVTFAFDPIPYCTKMEVIVYDRGGLFATTSIDYPAEGSTRNEKVIVPFWTGSPVEVSPDLINVIAISVAFTTTAVLVVKRREVL
ncbi:MAG TPA: hypothetical protein ENI42_02595 [Thermoplasmatales archaeon]|nr:hypothetical protein [Thermoplasmatales archaeon]